MRVHVWFSTRHEPERPWLIMREDGRVTAAADVALTDVQTAYRADAFRALPGGPKGVIAGRLVAATDELELEGGIHHG